MEQERRSFAIATSGGSAGFIALQVALLVVGLAAFLWLINIVALGGDWLPDISESLAPTTWIAILLPVLGVVFLAELLLFFFQRS